MPQQLSVHYSNKGGATQCQVYRNNNGALLALGNPFTPSQISGDADGLAKHNLAVQFGQYFYCSAGADLRRFNPGTGDWDVEVAAYYTAGGAIYAADLMVGRGPTGTPRLAIVFRNSVGQLSIRHLDIPGGTWSAQINPVLSVTGAAWPAEGAIKFNNEYVTGAAGEIITWNFDGSSITKQAVGSASILQPFAFTRAGNRLFAFAYITSTFGVYPDLYERVGGTWGKVIDGSINRVLPRVGSVSGNFARGIMLYDKAADSLIVQFWQDSAVAEGLGTSGVNLTNTNPGGNGIHAVQIPISMIGKGVIGPDAVGTGFAFAATTITRNDGGDWQADGVEIGSLIRVATAEDAGNIETWGPVTAVTAGVVTIASASFVVNADDTTVTFYLREHNLTGAIIPGAVAAPGGPDPTLDARGAREVDAETDPLNPAFYVWFCVANGIWQRYQYLGISTPMTTLGTGGDRAVSMSHNPDGGGEYFYGGSTTGSPAYHIEEAAARVQIVNGMRIFLRGSLIDETGGAPTPTDETVGCYWSTVDPTAKNLATIANVAKLSGPGNASPSISANKILGMTFDNSSIYQVDWLAGSGGDGLPDGATHLFMPHVEA